ncbi:MAG: translocation/assembly module TamB, partial [Cardiobacterium sp.]
MKPARLARGLYKTLKWLFLATLILALIAGGTLYWLLGSDNGYRRLPGLINHLTPYTLEYDTLEGRLLGEQRWHNLHLHGDGLDIRAAELRLNLRARDLLSGDINLDALQLKDAQITLPPASDTAEPPRDSTPPGALPTIDLPVALALHNITLDNIALQQNGQPLIHIHHAALDADYRDSRLTLQGTLDSDKGKASLDGSAETRGDYPLTLALDADTPLLPPAQNLQLRWQQSLLKPQLRLTLKGAISGDIQLDGDLSPDLQQLDASLAWQNLDYNQHEYQSGRGNLTLKGGLSALHGELQAAFAGKDLPPAQLTLNSDYGDGKLTNLDLTLATLGGSARFHGDANFSGTPAWRGTLDIANLNGKHWRPDLDLQLDGHIQPHGGDGQAHLANDRLSGHWQNLPVSGQGSLDY